MITTVSTVARELGETPVTIRYWSDEFAIRPARTSTNQRHYDASTIAKLRHVRWLLRVEGYTIAGAKRQLRLFREWRAA